MEELGLDAYKMYGLARRVMLGKMKRCTASSLPEAEKHMQNHRRKPGSSSVSILESSKWINISQ